MLSNYFKIAIRNLWRNRQFSIINISGLALGIAVFLLIVQFVAAEWNANRFVKSYSDLYRVNVQYKEGNTGYILPPGFAPAIKNQVPAIEHYTRIAEDIASGAITVQSQPTKEAQTFRENNIDYVDGNFLSVFSIPILSGSTSLDEPGTTAISETLSKKLFGTNDVINKTIVVSNQFGNATYTVKAVYKLPQESDLRPEILLSLNTLQSQAARNGNDWVDPNTLQSGFTSIYLQLRKGTDPKATANNIIQFVRSINPESKDDKVLLQPLSELHLAPSFDYPMQTYGSLLLVVVFAGIAVLILVIAWINYINLSTAQALTRAKEVGVRKVLGASRSQLIIQYLSDTFLLTLASALAALLLVNLVQNIFNEFTGKQLSFAVLNHGWFWMAGGALIITGSLLSGCYIAFVLTSYNPVTVIRGKVQSSGSGFSTRKGLVVFQFTISIVFIIATVILYKQLQFMQTENLGMKLDQLLIIKGPALTSIDQSQRTSSFKNTIEQLPFVDKFSASNNIPGAGYNFTTNGITRLNSVKNSEKTSYAMFISDDKFFDTYNITFAQGKTFSGSDVEASFNKVRKVVLNESAALSLGFKVTDNLVGEKILWGEPFEVIGVVKDYHHLSLREPIKPTIYLASPSGSYFTLLTDSRDMKSKLSTLKKVYTSQFGSNPFEYFFADENYDKQYKSEQKLGSLFVAAACVAVLIACLGLLGLATFSARQRIKEIGVRKVLGASVTDIAALLSKDFIKLVLVALVVASPIAWYVMHKWLQDFAYRTEINVWIFLLAGIIAVGIALTTISFHAVKAALANPVKSLRSE
jgi:putative ABC transport system permease protein